jgi:hypothetical protein
MKIFYKHCPICGKKQVYGSNSAFFIATKNNSKCRNCATISYAKRKGDSSKLLEESIISYYWIGFIMADGHISDNRLVVTLSCKDIEHLKKLASFLSCKIFIRKDKCSLALKDTKNLSELVKKYKIKHNKTYNPPDITSIKADNLKAFAVGFIDGDGHICNQTKRKDFKITIKCHSAWLHILSYVYGKSYINNSGYAVACITNSEIIKDLKKFVNFHKLPVLERKWNIINTNYISKQTIAKERKILVIELLQKGIPKKEIANIIGVSKSGVSQILKRLNYAHKI